MYSERLWWWRFFWFVENSKLEKKVILLIILLTLCLPLISYRARSACLASRVANSPENFAPRERGTAGNRIYSPVNSTGQVKIASLSLITDKSHNFAHNQALVFDKSHKQLLKLDFRVKDRIYEFLVHMMQ